MRAQRKNEKKEHSPIKNEKNHRKKTNSPQHLAQLLRRCLGPRARDQAAPGYDDRDQEGGKAFVSVFV